MPENLHNKPDNNSGNTGKEFFPPYPAVKERYGKPLEGEYICPSKLNTKNKRKYNSITKKICAIIALGYLGIILSVILAIVFALTLPRGYYLYRDMVKSIFYPDHKQQKMHSSAKMVKRIPTKFHGILQPSNSGKTTRSLTKLIR